MIDEPYVRAWLRDRLPAGAMPSPQLRERIRSALIEQPRPGSDRARQVAAGGLGLFFALLMIAVLIGIRVISSFDHLSPATTAPTHTQMPSPQSSAPTDTPAPKVIESPPPKVIESPPPKVIESPEAKPPSHGPLP